ncbi:MAG: hypothetical protein SXV54_14005 [Chloroflexota bacterium]|nr:hypothetical protein [Chloroflexota bacterium]
MESRYIRAALEAGCPEDQIARFISAGYVATPRQLQFHAACRGGDDLAEFNEVGFGGARGPGKSHALLAQIALDDCQRLPGCRVLLLRKVGKAVRESFEGLRRSVLGIPHQYKRSSGVVEFPNGSSIVLGHFRVENDVDNYLGLEYDVIGVEEATTLTLAKYKMIRTCCRTSKLGWRPRTYSNANPGGVGHTWYKRRFISGDRPFIPALVTDNPFIDAGYVDMLDELTGWLRRAWRFGDWDIHAGAYFSNLTPAHLLPNPDTVKGTNHEFILAVDYGFQHPTAAVLLALQGRNAYVLDSYRAGKQLTKQHSRALHGLLDRWRLERRHLKTFVLGADAWQRGKEGTSVADEYVSEGWNPEQAVMARVQGAQEILRRLGDADAGIEPSLWFYENTLPVYEQVAAMQHDPKRPEDVLKADVDEDGYGGDDLYDALRYGLQAVAEHQGAMQRSSLVFPK